MLDEEFRAGLDAVFPEVYARAASRVVEDRDKVLKLAQSDERRARFLARPYGAALLYAPYIRNAIPLGDHATPAYDTVVRIVLLVDRLHGWEPTEEEARQQVQRVLAAAFDPLELRAMIEKETGEGGKFSWAAPVVTPLLMPLFTPKGLFNLARRVPFATVWAVALIVATLATLPLVAGWSVATHCDRDATMQPRHVESVGVAGGTGEPSA